MHTDSKKISIDLIYAIFIIAFVGIFVLVNYFSGFNLTVWMISMIISFCLTFLHPRSGLYAIIFLTFVFERYFTLVPIVMGRSELKLYPIDVLLVAILISTGLQILFHKIKYKWTNVDNAMTLFSLFAVIYYFASILFINSDASLAFSSGKNYALYSLLFFITYFLIDSIEKIKEIFLMIFSASVFIVWFIVYGIIFKHGLWSEFTPLSTEGFRTLAFTHAYYLCMAVIIGLIYASFQKDRFTNVLMLLIPVWTIGIVGSMMRHLWISLAAMIVYIYIFITIKKGNNLKKFARQYVFIAVVGAVTLGYVALMMPNSSINQTLENSVGILGHRVTSIADVSSDDSILWRTTAWHQAIKKYAVSPIFGLGFGQTIAIELGNYRDFVEIRNIHNSFLVLLVQMGIFGIIALAYVIWKLAKNVFLTINKYDFAHQIAAYSSLCILSFQIIAFMFQPYLEANMLSIFFWINLGILRRIDEIGKNPS